MSIPDFQALMLPLLQFARDQREHASREAVDSLALSFELTDKEKEELQASGQQTIFGNRVYWALTHLKHAGILESTRRGFFKISQRGIEVLQQQPQTINMKFLTQYPEYRQFIRVPRKGKNAGEESAEVVLETITAQTPEELLEDGYQRIRQELAQELLNQVKKASPGFFEKLVVELLVKMGYGGSRKDAGEAIGKSGDEGIDGIIKEDRLGLDVIYIQAKRWETGVGRPEIQKFVGALHGQRARKGVFITTSDFTNDARRYVENIESKVVLIDGKHLAQLMIDNDIGVSKLTTYEIKKIDTDYFTEV